MSDLRAYFPSFLKQKPLVWGMSLQDLLVLSGVLFLLINIGVGEIPTLIFLALIYLSMIAIRRLYPKRHFEFILISKNSITRREINEKLRL